MALRARCARIALLAVAFAWGARLAGRTRERRLLQAEASAERVERLLVGQPGLTLIANAPNPAGAALLRGRFIDGQINPLKLLAGAAVPTAVALLCLKVL